MLQRRALLAVAGGAILAPAIVRAHGNWPHAKAVRFICPFAAGGNIGTVELARAAPDGYTIGLISVASHTLNPMLYSKLPCKGAGPVYSDLMAGIVNMMFANMPSMLPQVRGGKLKGLGVTSARRSKAAPDIPAIAETVPGYVATSWYGVGAPAGTSEPILAKLEAAIAEALASPDIQQRWNADLGLDMPPPGRRVLTSSWPRTASSGRPQCRPPA